MARMHERHDTFDSSLLCWLGTYLHGLPTCFSLPVLHSASLHIYSQNPCWIYMTVCSWPSSRADREKTRKRLAHNEAENLCKKQRIFVFVRVLDFGFWILDDGSVMTGLSSLLCDIFSEFLKEWLDGVIECLGYVRIRKKDGLF